MDGVLADFDEMIDRILYSKNSLKESQLIFWDEVDKVDHFFFKLKPTPYAVKLYNLARKVCNNVQILTALPADHVVKHARQDKENWIKKYIDQNVKVNFGPYSKDKWKHSNPGDILIDDRRSNILDWEHKGHGIGIVHYTHDYPRTERLLLEVAI